MKNCFFLSLTLILFVSCNQTRDQKVDNTVIHTPDISSKSNKYDDKVTKIDTTEYAREMYFKAKKQLESKGLDFCDTYNQINDLIKQSYKVGDKRYPNDPYKSDDYGEQWFNKQLRQLLKRNEIPDSTGNHIVEYEKDNCDVIKRPQYK
jgi:hypothetical protein